MLKGQEFGNAIREAIKLKIASGAIRSQAEVARHFGVKPPSVSDWIKKGSIEKGRLHDLWRYFADVAGPDHWGLTAAEWPFGLSAGQPLATASEAVAAWPFASIPEDQVRALSPGDLKALEGALALAIAQLRLNVDVTGPALHGVAARAEQSNPAPAHEDSDDPFPMGPMLPKAWEVQERPPPTTFGRPPRISRTSYVGHIADAGYSANDHEFSAVPELDVRLAAGKLGIENYTESQIGEMQLRTSFLESFGLPVERMRIVYGDGDSMEPVIRNRAPMLFYHEPVTDRTQIDPHTIYAINQGGKMLVKCIAKSRNSGWVMRSLNPTYPDAPLSDEDDKDVRILGLILWSPYDLRHGVDGRLLAR